MERVTNLPALLLCIVTRRWGTTRQSFFRNPDFILSRNGHCKKEIATSSQSSPCRAEEWRWEAREGFPPFKQRLQGGSEGHPRVISRACEETLKTVVHFNFFFFLQSFFFCQVFTPPRRKTVWICMKHYNPTEAERLSTFFLWWLLKVFQFEAKSESKRSDGFFFFSNVKNGKRVVIKYHKHGRV